MTGLIIILLVAVCLILSNRLRPDVVALGVALSLGLLGIITPEESLSGFSHPATLTLMALFVITQGVTRRGATRLITSTLARLGAASERRLLLATMAGGALLSFFMNNVAAAAIMLPPLNDAASRARVPPARLMMPLAFAASLGGMATLLTTGNLVVGAALRDAGFRPYGLLDFALVGLPVVAVGIVYMLVAGRRLLASAPGDAMPPNAPLPELAAQYAVHDRVAQFRVRSDSPLAGKTLDEIGIGSRLGVTALAIIRRGRFSWSPSGQDVIRADDGLVVVGRPERTEQLRGPGFTPESPAAALRKLEDGGPAWLELILAPRSRYAGQTLRQLGFRRRFEASVVAIWHRGQPIRTDVANIPLAFGDALLVHAGPRSLSLLRADPELLVLRAETPERIKPAGAALSAFIFAATLVIAAAGWLPTSEAMMLGLLATVLTARISMDEAYRAIDWRVVFTVAGMLPLSVAMTRTGLAAEIGKAAVVALAGLGPLAVGAGMLVATILLSQVMSSQVVAVIMAPIAIAAAGTLGVDPRAMAMYAALGSSCAFLTPTAHPVNLMVMGAGSYRALDYARVGAGLTIAVVAVILLVTPLVYRF